MTARALPPRVVLVTRPTELELLVAAHGTRGQAAFVLEGRGQSLRPVEARHVRFHAAREAVLAAIPAEWRRTGVPRDDVDRFPFGPDDIVVCLGQDGLVANVARYVADGPPVIGVNPDPDSIDGLLCRHEAGEVAGLLRAVHAGRADVEARTMAACELDDGQRLLGLNELFLGHRSHQSARYELTVGDVTEAQSSSGIVVGTGTGATGWCASIRRERAGAPQVPAPTAPELVLFVREAWPSSTTGTALSVASLHGDALAVVTSRLEVDGVVFADGIEHDRLELPWGTRATLGVARERLLLV